jgi:uncharacterized membrane protein HdeD (DUF308 family)
MYTIAHAPARHQLLHPPPRPTVLRVIASVAIGLVALAWPEAALALVVPAALLLRRRTPAASAEETGRCAS